MKHWILIIAEGDTKEQAAMMLQQCAQQFISENPLPSPEQELRSAVIWTGENKLPSLDAIHAAAQTQRN